jgi:hypothetical protein
MNSQIPYTGPNRRMYQRRQNTDRRELIRFEPDKEPRRKGNGRRNSDLTDHWSREFF